LTRFLGAEYDLVGRQTLRTGPAGDVERQEIDYSEFDLPLEVRIGPDDAPLKTVTYHYDAHQQR
jgi:hypothetical protein